MSSSPAGNLQFELRFLALRRFRATAAPPLRLRDRLTIDRQVTMPSVPERQDSGSGSS
jgi:hypothetical protein